MSTRSLTHIHDAAFDSPVLVTTYKHCDGHPSAYGRELLKMLKGESCENTGKLAAKTVGKLNSMCGVSVYPPGHVGGGAAFTYHVYTAENTVRLRIFEADGEDIFYRRKGAQIFDGVPTAFPEWLEAFIEKEANPDPEEEAVKIANLTKLFDEVKDGRAE